MKKALALILGIILVFATIPSISAFADSDPGFSNLVLNHSFSWYSDFPYVDTYGWIYNSYLQSATLVSNGVTSYPSPSTVPTLYQEGDYFEVSFNSDLLSNYQTPLWNVMIAYDSSTASTHYDIPLNSINCYLCDELAFYDFQTESYADGRRWRCICYICPSNYLSNTTIRIEYNGNGGPITVPITMICLRGYRFTPSGSLTEQEMVELQSNIVNALNTARLADLIGNLDTSDVDLTTLENTTASILQKLTSVPDIIQYIDQIETLDTNILSGINTFLNYYNDNFKQANRLTSYDVKYYDTQHNQVTNASFSSNDFWVCIPIDKSYGYIRFCLYQYWSSDIFTVDAYVYYTQTFSNNFFPVNIYHILNYGFSSGTAFDDIYYFPDYLNNSSTYYLYLNFKSNNPRTVYTSLYTNRLYYKNYNVSWFDRIELYLKQLLGFDRNSVTPSIDQVNNTVADQIDDITQFEDTYNQSLDTSASQIDVSSYQITQTSGMSWMRTYTEYNFDQMQNFRILLLTPLVLALAAFFLRRKQ